MSHLSNMRVVVTGGAGFLGRVVCDEVRKFGPAELFVPRKAQYDLTEQADAYHGLLLAINDRPWVGGLLTYGYLPHVTLRDKSLSVRGKPAEAVLGAWWPGLTGP